MNNWFILIPNFTFFNSEFFEFFFQCIPTSIYISTLFQLHLIAPIFILYSIHYPSVGVTLSIIAIIISRSIAVYPLFVNLNQNSINTLTIDKIKAEILNDASINTHLTNFLIGTITAFLIVKKPNIYLGGKWAEILLWILCPAITIASVVWSEQFDILEQNSMLFIAFSRILWLLGFVWIFYYCCTHSCGNSLSFWSRIHLKLKQNYCFLIHRNHKSSQNFSALFEINAECNVNNIYN